MPGGMKQKLIQGAFLPCQCPPSLLVALHLRHPCFPFQDLLSPLYLVSSPFWLRWLPVQVWAQLNGGFPCLGRLSPHAAFPQRHLENPAEPLC